MGSQCCSCTGGTGEPVADCSTLWGLAVLRSRIPWTASGGFCWKTAMLIRSGLMSCEIGWGAWTRMSVRSSGSMPMDVGFWWQRHGLHGALLIFYLDGLLADEVSLALAALCRGFVALGGAAKVLACDVESHSRADDWLDAFDSGWPPEVRMPCVLMLGEAVSEVVERDCARLPAGATLATPSFSGALATTCGPVCS